MSDAATRDNPALFVFIGLFLTAVLHSLQFPLAVAAGAIMCAIDDMDDYCVIVGAVPFIFIGVSQLIYMLPAIGLVFWKWNKPVGIGLVIGAAATLLVNGAFLALVAFG